MNIEENLSKDNLFSHDYNLFRHVPCYQIIKKDLLMTLKYNIVGKSSRDKMVYE